MPAQSTPPSIAKTAAVAAAASRILSAYVSNHRLSAAETARLSAAITGIVTGLAAGTALAGPTLSQPGEPGTSPESAAALPKRRASRRPRPQVAEEQSEFDLDGDEEAAAGEAAAGEAAPDEVVADEVVADEAAADEALEPAGLPQSDTGPEEHDVAPSASQPVAADVPDAEAEADRMETELAAEASAPAEGKKRKRPSRPRSKRGGARQMTAGEETTDVFAAFDRDE